MTGRSPARLLAPLALVLTAIALFAVVTSGGGGEAAEEPAAVTPAPTSTPSSKSNDEKDSKDKGGRQSTYTVQPGDTPSGIAEELGISTERLLELNPDADPNALSPGQKLKVPG